MNADFFNSLSEAEKIDFIRDRAAANFAYKSVLFYPEYGMGIYYQRSKYEVTKIHSIAAFTISANNNYIFMQQCCKQQ